MKSIKVSLSLQLKKSLYNPTIVMTLVLYLLTKKESRVKIFFLWWKAKKRREIPILCQPLLHETFKTLKLRETTRITTWVSLCMHLMKIGLKQMTISGRSRPLKRRELSWLKVPARLNDNTDGTWKKSNSFFFKLIIIHLNK